MTAHLNPLLVLIGYAGAFPFPISIAFTREPFFCFHWCPFSQTVWTVYPNTPHCPDLHEAYLFPFLQAISPNPSAFFTVAFTDNRKTRQAAPVPFFCIRSTTFSQSFNSYTQGCQQTDNDLTMFFTLTFSLHRSPSPD